MQLLKPRVAAKQLGGDRASLQEFLVGQSGEASADSRHKPSQIQAAGRGSTLLHGVIEPSFSEDFCGLGDALSPMRHTGQFRRLSGTMPPFSASLAITALWSAMFCSALPSAPA